MFRYFLLFFGFFHGGHLLQGETFFIAPETDTAVEKGLDFFRKRLQSDQLLGDGAFRNNPAITALTGMAFLASGSTPREGKDAWAVQKCLETLLQQTRSDGTIAPETLSGQGLMYGHGFAVLFLADCYGMTSQDAQIRSTLEKAIVRIVQAQNPDGGWRYTLTPQEEDTSVTACMMMALRGCRNAGLEVPAEVMEKGVAYLKKCQNPDGGFRYRLMEGASAFPRSAAAIAALCAGGIYEGEEMDRGLAYLSLQFPQQSPESGYYPYGLYYAIQAVWLCESPRHPWSAWYESMTKDLLARQKPDGSWISPISIDYATAMALIVLQIPNHSLPIFQR